MCTAHLASDETDEVAANNPQCAELRALLARRAGARTVIFGGDVNRRSSCAPHGFWVRTDTSAHQDPGSQHAYGTAALRSPSAQVVLATHTDHDFLLVHAHLIALAMEPPRRGAAAANRWSDQLRRNAARVTRGVTAFSATTAILWTRPARSQSLQSRWATSS